MSINRPLSYDFVPKPVGDPPVYTNHVLVACADCGTKEEAPWRKANNPHHIAEHFRQRRWSFDIHRKSHVLCPSCSTTKKPTQRPDTILPRLETFGERFRYLRDQGHLKREQVAAESGLDKDILGYLESGQEITFRIADSTVEKLISVLSAHKIPVNRSWLLDLPQAGTILARRFRAKMEELHLSEVTLAERSRVPVSHIKLILSGAISDHVRLADLARVMRCRAEDLNGLVTIREKEEEKNPDTAHRLKGARQAKGMTQAELAGRIKQYGGTDWSERTIENIIGKIEHGTHVAGQTVLLMIAGDILDVNTDWLLCRADDPTPTTPLPEASHVTIDTAEEIEERLARAEADLDDLRTLLDEQVSIVLLLRRKLEGTKIPVLEKAKNETSRDQDKINRDHNSKQNAFARGLLQERAVLKTITVADVEQRLGNLLSTVIPPTCRDRQAYIHALMRRETLADNGILAKVGRGAWSFRDEVTI